MNRLSIIRRALGFSQAEMARRLGIGRRTYQEQEVAPDRRTVLAALAVARLFRPATSAGHRPRRGAAKP